MSRVPALSDFIAMTTRDTHRHPTPRFLLHCRKLLECRSSLNPQNLTTHSWSIFQIQIKLIYKTTILLKAIPKKRRNPDNEHALRLQRNGSHIGTLTSRNCFATMDEKGCR